MPKYLKLNLDRHAEVFTNHKIVLIHNSKNLDYQNAKLRFYKYVPDKNWFNLEKLLGHSKDFRGNFWMTSCARLFALKSYMETSNEELIHTESDVVLSEDFPFDEFSKINEPIAYPIISKVRGAGSIIYVRNLDAVNLLTSTILSEAASDSMTTEMIILRHLYQARKLSIRPLPIGPSTPDCYSFDVSSELPRILEDQKVFDGCFDGVDIGQYFFGTDPRNRRGKYLIRKNIVNGYLKVERTRLEWNEERRFFDIYDKDLNSCTKLYSIHLAVKKINYFNKKKQLKYLQDWVKKQKLPGERFSLRIFVNSALISVKRRVRLIVLINR